MELTSTIQGGKKGKITLFWLQKCDDKLDLCNCCFQSLFSTTSFSSPSPTLILFPSSFAYKSLLLSLLLRSFSCLLLLFPVFWFYISQFPVCVIRPACCMVRYLLKLPTCLIPIYNFHSVHKEQSNIVIMSYFYNDLTSFLLPVDLICPLSSILLFSLFPFPPSSSILHFSPQHLPTCAPPSLRYLIFLLSCLLLLHQSFPMSLPTNSDRG